MIQHFTFQYTDPTNGVTYPITMVGSDPRSGGSSTIHTVIVPLKLNFVAAGQDTSVLNDLGFAGFTAPPLNHTFDGGRRVNDVLSSPIFKDFKNPAVMGGDPGQVGDTFMRAQFNKIRTDYHVKLVNDAVIPATLDVPSTKGIAYQRPVGCCILGYHGAAMPVGHGSGSANGDGKQPVQTFIYAAWTTPGTYSGFLSDYTGSRSAPLPTRGLADVHALSHEVSEWLDDPYVNNAVQPWLTPTAPQYGCTDVLETGDPVVGVWFPLAPNNTGATDGYNYYGQYHPEDEVFAQWFGRGGVEQVFGSAYNGNLTFMGPLTTGIGGGYAGFGSYAQGC